MMKFLNIKVYNWVKFEAEECLNQCEASILAQHTWIPELRLTRCTHKTLNKSKRRGIRPNCTSPSYIKSSWLYVLLSDTQSIGYFMSSLTIVNASSIRILMRHGMQIDGWDTLRPMLFWGWCRCLWTRGLSSLVLAGIILFLSRMVLTKNMRFPLAAGLIFLFRSLFLVHFLIYEEHLKVTIWRLHCLA